MSWWTERVFTSLLSLYRAKETKLSTRRPKRVGHISHVYTKMLVYAPDNTEIKQYSSCFYLFRGRKGRWTWSREVISSRKLSCKPKVILCVKQISLTCSGWHFIRSLLEEWHNIIKIIKQINILWLATADISNVLDDWKFDLQALNYVKDPNAAGPGKFLTYSVLLLSEFNILYYVFL